MMLTEVEGIEPCRLLSHFGLSFRGLVLELFVELVDWVLNVSANLFQLPIFVY